MELRQAHHIHILTHPLWFHTKHNESHSHYNT